MKNYYWGAFIVSFSILVILLGLNNLPDINLLGRKMRKVDMLSDVRPDVQTAPIVEDTVKLEEIVKKEIVFNYVDTCEEGLTCIVDYADSTLRGMSHFYSVLDSIDSLDRPVRIAFFGDSFIEGDIFTADLRELLQTKFGGKGVGWVNITSNVANFRPTVVHKFSGWKSVTLIDSIRNNRLLGLNSSYYIPTSSESYVELEGTSRYASHVATAEVSSIYFKNECDTLPMHLSCSINGNPDKEIVVNDKGFNTATVRGDISSVRWTVDGSCKSVFWGVTMESRKGIIVDNLSLRGSSGFNSLSIPTSSLTEFAENRKYDLIILQYGLNVASEGRREYSGYKDNMEEAIDKLKSCFPNTSILLFSVGDRMVKDDNGNLITMPEVVNLANYQEAIAADSNIAFWSLLTAFKSLGGISSFAKAEPPMANLDFTHINFRGGKALAKEFYDALMHGKEQFDKANANVED